MVNLINIKNKDIAEIILFFWFSDKNNREELENQDYNWNREHISIVMNKLNLLNKEGIINGTSKMILLRYCGSIDKIINKFVVKSNYIEINSSHSFMTSFDNNFINVGAKISGDRTTNKINNRTNYDFMKFLDNVDKKYFELLNRVLEEIENYNFK